MLGAKMVSNCFNTVDNVIKKSSMILLNLIFCIALVVGILYLEIISVQHNSKQLQTEEDIYAYMYRNKFQNSSIVMKKRLSL